MNTQHETVRPPMSRWERGVELDGVMQGFGGPDDDRSGGYERGGWIWPHFDAEAGRS